MNEDARRPRAVRFIWKTLARLLLRLEIMKLGWVLALCLMPIPASAQPADHAGHGMEMTGLLGPYPMSREASGTAWQPESSPTEGYPFMAGAWMFMVHGFADVVYDRQGGPRGDDDVFGPNMAMLMGQRSLGGGTLGVRGMLSLDPASVGGRGYPLLLQTGETADGREPLIDRQHPHDLFMELAAAYSRPFKNRGSLFAYVGFPGEPALGPPTFMHRFSGVDLPEAPITHHWLDATHITFGVATLGVTWKGAKAEASSFTGREPDQQRWNFDTPKFDSWSGRLSINPTADLALQLSAAHIHSPEQLEPDVDVDRYTASLMYNRRVGARNWQTTAAWGLNHKQGESLNGGLLETAWSSGPRHTALLRGELVEKDELFATGPLAGARFVVGKLSAGYVYEVGQVRRVGLGIGAIVSRYRIPAALLPAYGDSPTSFMIFARTRLR